METSSPSSQEQDADGEPEILREAECVLLPLLLGDQHLHSTSPSSLRSPAIPILGQLLNFPPCYDGENRRKTNVTTSTMVEGDGGDQMKVENISIIKTVESSSDSSQSIVHGTPPLKKKNRLSRKRKLVPMANSTMTQFYRQTKSANTRDSASLGVDDKDISTTSGQEKNTTKEKHLDDGRNERTEDTPELPGSPYKSCALSSSTVDTVLELSDGETVLSSPQPGSVCQYPTISSDRVYITIKDYTTLDQGTFLNDIMIDFYLKYLHKEILAQPDQAKVHIFSTMFYKRLTVDPEEGSKMYRLEKNSNMSMVEKRHKRVKRWTKNFQLFDKNLVLIPICEYSHWFMVVLVRPGGEQPCMMLLDSLSGDNTRAVDIVKKYLEIEGREEVGEKVLTNLKKLKVVRPNIPLQNNGFDCGVFLLHYAEKMLER